MELVIGGPTKPEIAAIALSKLGLSDQMVFADIGCGTANISIMAASKVKDVYSIDSRQEAIAAASKNIQAAQLDNIRLIQGVAPAVLEELPSLDCAFVGGTRNIEQILDVLSKKVKGRIVANAVRLQTVSMIIRTMQDLGIFLEALHIQVSRTYPLAGDVAFRPINPVYIIVGDTNQEEHMEEH